MRPYWSSVAPDFTVCNLGPTLCCVQSRNGSFPALVVESFKSLSDASQITSHAILTAIRGAGVFTVAIATSLVLREGSKILGCHTHHVDGRAGSTQLARSQRPVSSPLHVAASSGDPADLPGRVLQCNVLPGVPHHPQGGFGVTASSAAGQLSGSPTSLPPAQLGPGPVGPGP